MSIRALKNFSAIMWLVGVMAVASPIYAGAFSDEILPPTDRIDAWSRLSEYHTSTIVSIIAMLLAFLATVRAQKHVMSIIVEHNKVLKEIVSGMREDNKEREHEQRKEGP